MTNTIKDISDLNLRSREILREIVESYLSTGEPVGSRNLARSLPMSLSPASVRNVMSDLERIGLIEAPHASAGRRPTHSGLRLFIDGLLEIGDLSKDERKNIEHYIGNDKNRTVNQVLTEASKMISGLSHCAGVVLAEKEDIRLKHIEFVPLEPGKALVVMVGDNQNIENRIIDLPKNLPPSALVEAGNYLSSNIAGMTIAQAHEHIEKQIESAEIEFDELTKKVIEAGIAEWSGAIDDRKSLIVRGQSNLLKDLTAIEELERIRQLFDDLESKRNLVQILGLTEGAEGVKIFIGSENKLFSLSGSSLIVAPFHDNKRQIVGALGIIGPTRLNYARIIPMVDYTAKIISRMLT